jgi:hypothetical protein
MDMENKLRNNLVRRLQQLSSDKLTEVQKLLNEIESQLKSKDETLKLAGSWRDLDHGFFSEMTENLHENRANDRQIS